MIHIYYIIISFSTQHIYYIRMNDLIVYSMFTLTSTKTFLDRIFEHNPAIDTFCIVDGTGLMKCESMRFFLTCGIIFINNNRQLCPLHNRINVDYLVLV